MAKHLTFTDNTTGDLPIATCGFPDNRTNFSGIVIIIPAGGDLGGATVQIKARPHGTIATPEPIKKCDGTLDYIAGDQERLNLGNNMDYFINIAGGTNVNFQVYQSDVV